MFKKVIIVFILALMISFACSDKPNVAPTGQFNLYIQGGMADYDSVFVIIDTVYSYLTLDSTISTIQYIGPDTIEVSSLRNGRDHLLFQNELKPGAIDGISIAFGGGRVVIDDSSYNFQPLDGDDFRVTDSYPLLIAANSQTNALIDINLFESLTPEGSFYYFDPSIRLIDIDSSGAFSGRTFPQAHVFLYNHDSLDTLSFTISEGDLLEFGFYGLEPGSYDFLCAPIGDDTLQYQSLFNEVIQVIAGDNYYLGLLPLPQP